MSNESVIFMGADGTVEDAFIEASGNTSEGIYATFGGLPVSELGQDFVSNYEERFGGGVEAYTVYGYEVANVLLDAIERAYNANGEVTREGVVRELFASSTYSGVLGTWSFDQDGDTTHTELSGQRLQGGEFGFDKVIDVDEANSGSQFAGSPV
jgi:branched-chain amino acid transport system substrate-binding protein